MFNNFNYEPTDIDDELFLSEVPLNLIEKSIDSQFLEPLEYRKKDYIQSFITKYDFSQKNLHDEDKEELSMLHDKFISFIIKKFSLFLSIEFPNIEDIDEDEQHELLLLTYRFFIKNIKKNFTSLISNYIDRNKEEIANDETIVSKKRDVTTMNFKTEIDDESDIIIISNLESIIHYILSQEFTVDDFFDLIDDNNCLETEFVKEKFNEFEIVGNFVPEYIKMIDLNFYSELESKLRNKILKKYPKRNKKTTKEESTESEYQNDE